MKKSTATTFPLCRKIFAQFFSLFNHFFTAALKIFSGPLSVYSGDEGGRADGVLSTT
jgi:hypothetical protein